MDQIRTSLEVLFIDQDIKGLYDNKLMDDKSFASKLRDRGLGGTLDQLGIVARLVSDKWMKPDPMISELCFNYQDSVFNVLLHASSPLLHMYNNKVVCRYEKLFRWQALTNSLGEDLLVTSYLAAYDLKNGHVRKRFDWNPCIEHDCGEINLIFEKEMVELHSHLYGSSLNFDISWMNLMNNPRSEAVIPAAIRYYLFLMLHKIDDDINIREIVTTGNALLREYQTNSLRHKINVANHLLGRKSTSSKGMGNENPDYALVGDDNGIFSILGGERRFMYDMFQQIYSGRINDTIYPQLFHIYLLEKERIRHSQLQLNDGVGFANFANYDERKCKYIPWKTVYSQLLQQMAIGSYLSGKEDKRYIEARIVPKTKVKDNILALSEITRAIERNDTLGSQNNTEKWNYRFIYHFIKQKDISKLDNLNPRHARLRNKVKQQATAIFAILNSKNSIRRYIVGIDAANSEMLARPEVFAQAYRYLRHNDKNCDTLAIDPGMTYHVGEDFYDIVDGLRALDEVIRFLEFRNGDRIGHGLVLGTDVQSYYQYRNHAVCAPREVLLDNAAWLYNVSLQLMPYSPSHTYILKIFKYYYNLVYGQIPYSDIKDYYDSWLLRGDDPATSKESIANSIDRWQKYSYCRDVDVAIARENPKAVSLYNAYHYNERVKREGSVGDILKIEPGERQCLYDIILRVQEYFLSKIEQKHISIECNPTSNIRIGDMRRYEEHPIFKFNNYGIETGNPFHSISVSINTDDKGVFGTSQEREYSLIALALEKKKELGNKPRQVIEWLDKIRQVSLSNTFN